MKPKRRSDLVREEVRGLVPNAAFGKEDTTYESYLQTIRLNDVDVQIQLAIADDQRFQAFLKIMSQPNQILKPQTVAKRCGITLDEFAHWYSKALNQIAIAKAQNAAVPITEDMGKDARTRQEPCGRCDGLGWVVCDELPAHEAPEGYRVLKFVKSKSVDESGNEQETETAVWIRNCPAKCDRGMVTSPGDQHSRDKILEMSGLIDKKGHGVSLTMNFGGASHPSALRTLNSIDIDADK